MEDVLVTMETRRVEEERWRRIFPEIRKCSVVLVRPRPEQLKAWSLRRTERRRSQRVRSREPTAGWDWMEPLEAENGDHAAKRFVKKVEVKVPTDAPEEGLRNPHSRIRLTHCPESATDSAHSHGTDYLSREEPDGDHNYCRGSDTPDCRSQSQEAR